jgi:hypothetical protein
MGSDRAGAVLDFLRINRVFALLKKNSMMQQRWFTKVQAHHGQPTSLAGRHEADFTARGPGENWAPNRMTAKAHFDFWI